MTSTRFFHGGKHTVKGLGVDTGARRFRGIRKSGPDLDVDISPAIAWPIFMSILAGKTEKINY